MAEAPYSRLVELARNRGIRDPYAMSEDELRRRLGLSPIALPPGRRPVSPVRRPSVVSQREVSPVRLPPVQSRPSQIRPSVTVQLPPVVSRPVAPVTSQLPRIRPITRPAPEVRPVTQVAPIPRVPLESGRAQVSGGGFRPTSATANYFNEPTYTRYTRDFSQRPTSYFRPSVIQSPEKSPVISPEPAARASSPRRPRSPERSYQSVQPPPAYRGVPSNRSQYYPSTHYRRSAVPQRSTVRPQSRSPEPDYDDLFDE